MPFEILRVRSLTIATSCAAIPWVSTWLVRSLEVHASPGQSPPDLLITFAGMIEEGGYQESDFPGPNWKWLANEERVTSQGAQMN
jgi:hypothetical protein